MPPDLPSQYLDLLKKSLTFLVYADAFLDPSDNDKPRLIRPQPAQINPRIEGQNPTSQDLAAIVILR